MDARTFVSRPEGADLAEAYRQALRAQQAPLRHLGCMDALGAFGLFLLGHPLCGLASFVTLFGLDVVLQRRLASMQAAAGNAGAGGFARLAWMGALRHTVLLGGASGALIVGQGHDEAFYLALTGATVLLLATFQCAFDRRLVLAASAPGALALALGLLFLLDEPRGVALALGGVLFVMVSYAISLTTVRIRGELARGHVERLAAMRELAAARDAAEEGRRLAERAQTELGRREALLAQTARMARIGSWELNLRSSELFWSEETFRIHGLDPATPIDSAFAAGNYGKEHREMMGLAFMRLLTFGESFDHEVTMHTHAGETIWVRCMGEAETVDGEVVRAIGSIQDISDRRRQEERIHHLAFRDGLTGLPNRSAFQDGLREALAAEGGCGLLLLDLDHFKDVNDSLGHDAGDELLRAAADRLRSMFRPIDTVARLGGDEFAVVLPGAPSEDWVLALAQAACRALSQPVVQGDARVDCSASLGAAFTGRAGAEAAQFLKDADIALYAAKALGRNRAALFEPAMRERIEDRYALLREVRAGIEDGEFEPWFQPIVRLPSQEVAGFEALVRWRRPDGRVLTPAAFQAALDDAELSSRLGELMLDAVLTRMQGWRRKGVDFGRVAVNLASSQFRNSDLAGHVAARLRRWGVAPEELAVEVTEGVYMGAQSERVSRTVTQLHELGVQVALDDFGTGFASLATLRQFPIDVLKIDKSFLQDAADSAVVRGVVELGSRLGMTVVAEGVEDAHQLATLVELGCHKAQGYLFSTPLPGGEVPRFLRQWRPAATPEAAPRRLRA